MATNTNDKYTQYHSDRMVYTSNGWQSRDVYTTRSTGIPWAMIVGGLFVLFIIGILVVNAI